MSEINTSKLEYTGSTTPANTSKVQEAAFSGAFAGASSRAPAVVVVDANLDDAVGAAAPAVTPPTGGFGLMGWLSGIYSKLSNTLDIRALSSATDSVAVSGSVNVSNLPATQAVSGSVSVDNFPATQAVSGTVAVSNLPTLQEVEVSNFPATQAVSGTVSVSNFPASQAVSGTVSVSNFPATQAVSVGNFPATQAVSGTVSVGNFPSTQAVSGTVTANLGSIAGVATEATLSAASAKLPASLGAKAGTASLSIVPATDAGLSTSALQSAGNTTLASIDAKTPALVSGAVPVSGPLTDTQLRAAAVAVSLATQPLPDGAATSALQTSGNASLASLDSKTPALGQALAAASSPVVIASNQTAIPFNITQLNGVALDGTGLPSTEHQDYEAASRVYNAPINPTPLTGVALTTATQTAYTNTAPSILISAGAKPVTVKEIYLRVTGVGATISALYLMGVMDSVSRFTSGGTLVTARNNALASSAASIRVATAAIVATAPSATARTVFNPVVVKAASPVANDMYAIVFGEPSRLYGVGTWISLPPVRIPANGSLALHLIGTGMTAAPTFEGTIVIQE